MKFLAIIVLALGVAAAVPTRAVAQEWTLSEITAALENPATSPVLVPYLVDALNAIMASLYTGEQISTITVALPVDVVAAITPVATPGVAPVTLPAAATPEVVVDVAPITLPAVAPVPHPVVTPVGAVDYVPLVQQQWTLAEINAALASPHTNPAMVPYLHEALDSIMDSLFAGEQVTTAVVAVPVTVIDAPVDTAVVATPVAAPVATPVAPVAAETSSGPLVQIILNINSQQVGEQVVAAPVATTPVHDISVGPAVIEAVPSVADISPALVDISPAPVSVGPAFIEAVPSVADISPALVDISPAPVSVGPAIIDAVPSVADITPALVGVNPIDVVAVAAPEVIQVAVPVVAGPMI